MKHIKPISADVKELDWGLNTGLGGIVVIIQAIITVLNSIAQLKGTHNSESTNS